MADDQTQQELQKTDALYAVVASNGWKYIEEIIKEETAKLRDLQNIDRQIIISDPQATQVEIRARDLAIERLEKIIGRVNSYGNGVPAKRRFPSMR